MKMMKSKLKLLHRVPRYRMGLYVCACGNTKEIRIDHVKSKRTRSCGCLKIGHPSHGLSGTRFYIIYSHLLSRCNNKNVSNYHNYGGRGISCSWKSFEDFKKDMYDSYKIHIKEFGKNTQIDRIDTNKGYSKSNCRWTTASVQANNRRNTIRLKYRGNNLTLNEWSRKLNVKYGTLWSRYSKKLSIEKILHEKDIKC